MSNWWKSCLKKLVDSHFICFILTLWVNNLYAEDKISRQQMWFFFFFFFFFLENRALRFDLGRHLWVWEKFSKSTSFVFLQIITLTLVLLNPDIPCLFKQCRSRSVGFWRSQLIWICTVCHLASEFIAEILISNQIGWKLEVGLKKVVHLCLNSTS